MATDNKQTQGKGSRYGKSDWEPLPDNPRGVLRHVPEPWADILRGFDGDGVGILNTLDNTISTVGERARAARIEKVRWLNSKSEEIRAKDGDPHDLDAVEFLSKSQTATASAIGIKDVRTLDSKENGTGAFTVPQLLKLSAYLGVHPAWVLGVISIDEQTILNAFGRMNGRHRAMLVEIAQKLAADDNPSPAIVSLQVDTQQAPVEEA